jgi:hypothetical protein
MKLFLKRLSDVSSDLIVTNNSKFIEKIGTITIADTNYILNLDFLKFKKYISGGAVMDNKLKTRLKEVLVVITSE